MKNLHIHEVLIDMQDQNRSFASKEEFTKYISDVFGDDCRFYACSADNMNANDAFEFLLYKGKIALNEKEEVSLDPSMTMCDGHNHHH